MNPYYLDRDDLLTASTTALGQRPIVRDFGLLDAALARPRSSVFGMDAYMTIFDKAAALVHSLTLNHALLDGNKRTAWAGAWVFLEVNGHALDPDFNVDEAEILMNKVARSECDLNDIAVALRAFSV